MKKVFGLPSLAVAILVAFLLSASACAQQEPATDALPPSAAEPASTSAPPVATAPPSGSAVTRIEDVRPGSSVDLQGTVTRILDEDEFRMEDETGSIRVYIGWRNRVPVEVGERVRVRGIVDDDLVDAFRPEVYADELVRADGTVVPLTRGDY